MPVGSGKSIEGLHSLVVATLPQDAAGGEMENFPVGLLDDLDKWVNIAPAVFNILGRLVADTWIFSASCFGYFRPFQLAENEANGDRGSA